MYSVISNPLSNGVGSKEPLATSSAAPVSASRPDPEVTQRIGRRRLTAAHKLAILNEADRCTQPEQIGALLRKEGLYSAALTNFRKQRDAGRLSIDPAQLRQQRLVKESARQRDARKIASLEATIAKKDVLLELQKKVSELLLLAQQTQADY